MISNFTIPGSVLKERHSTNCFNKIRECMAAGLVNLVHCPSEDNLADKGHQSVKTTSVPTIATLWAEGGQIFANCHR